jgi:hypothetical protein
VYVTESLLAPAPPVIITSPSVAGFAGEHWRGPVGVAIACTSWQQFVQFYGGFNSSNTPVLTNPWLPYAVYEFFNNGGSQCYINRIQASITPGAAASITLKDSAATPQSTLKLTAGFYGISSSTNPDVGTWGNNLYAQVTVPQIQNPSFFNLTIFYGGTAPGNIVEQWNNLTMSASSSRYAPTVLNSNQGGSGWVVATDLFSASAAPLNTPGVSGPTQFTGGIDTASPSVADRQGAWTYGSAASGFDAVPGVLNMNAPGESTAAVLGTAISYASGGSSGRPYSFLVIDPAQGASVATAISYMQTLQGLNNSSFAALYYPWVNVVNPASSALQATIDMPPGGVVLGQMSTVDTANGPWYAPAGMGTTTDGVVSTERVLTPANYGSLNVANVNALKTLPNGTVILWGARTMLTQLTDVYVPIRRTLNYVEAGLSNLLQYAVFQPNDPLLWAAITSTCTTFLANMAARNAFQGVTQSQQFYVTCNSTNNTPTSIQQGVVNVQVGLALNYPAEFIQLNIQQFTSTGVITTTSNI